MNTTTITIEHNGKTYSGQIMTIKSTTIGMEDHGIVTAYLNCEYNGGGISVGGMCLDTPVKDADGKFLRREGTAFGLDHLMALVHTVGAPTWEACKGREVFVLFEGTGGHWGSMAVGIAGLLNGEVLILKEHAEEWLARKPVTA